MKWIFVTCVYALMLYQVLAAPSDRFSSEEGDSVEQELIRNHHSAALERLKSKVQQASSETEESSPVESIEEVVESDDEDDKSITEDDLYDITVGDVIRDVLLTLRDHPEIVKELIASEKAKLAEQINAFNSLVDGKSADDTVVDGNSAGDSLAGFMKPAEQLSSVPKSVEKKTGRSGMAVIPGQAAENKRAEEVINDEYTRSIGTGTGESQQYNDFMHQPREGGQSDPMFDYEKQNSEFTDGTNSEHWSSPPEAKYEDTRESLSDSNDINGYQTSNSATDNAQMEDIDSDKDSVKSSSRDSQTDDAESNENDESENFNNEAALAWLLHNGRTRNSAEHTISENRKIEKRYINM